MPLEESKGGAGNRLRKDFRGGLDLIFSTLREDPEYTRPDESTSLRLEVVEIAEIMDSCDPESLSEIELTLENLPAPE